jgi:hypothetical protein
MATTTTQGELDELRSHLSAAAQASVQLLTVHTGPAGGHELLELLDVAWRHHAAAADVVRRQWPTAYRERYGDHGGEDVPF